MRFILKSDCDISVHVGSSGYCCLSLEKKIFRIPYEQQYVLFTYLMYYVIKIHFYLFSEECEIDSHLQFTRNCRYNSDDRIFSTSKGAVVFFAQALSVELAVLCTIKTTYTMPIVSFTLKLYLP